MTGVGSCAPFKLARSSRTRGLLPSKSNKTISPARRAAFEILRRAELENAYASVLLAALDKTIREDGLPFLVAVERTMALASFTSLLIASLNQVPN